MKFDQTVRKRTAEDVGPYSAFSVYVNFVAVRFCQTVSHGRSQNAPTGVNKLAVSAYLKSFSSGEGGDRAPKGYTICTPRIGANSRDCQMRRSLTGR